MRFPKPNNIVAEKYVAGMSLFKSKLAKIKLSANESALGMSPLAKKAISQKNLVLDKYPDGKSTNLKMAISKACKCNFDKIVCGAGSDEIIQMLCQLYLNPKDEVIVPQYSFLMYRIYAKIVGAKVVFAKENNFKVSIEEILKKKTKIAFNEFEKQNNMQDKIFVVAGGVAANKKIRSMLMNLCKENNYQSVFPPIEICGDNAAMIAMVGLEKYKLKLFIELDHPAKPRWPLDENALFLKGAGVKL